jgi:hypothetical protein
MIGVGFSFIGLPFLSDSIRKESMLSISSIIMRSMTPLLTAMAPKLFLTITDIFLPVVSGNKL